MDLLARHAGPLRPKATRPAFGPGCDYDLLACLADAAATAPLPAAHRPHAERSAPAPAQQPAEPANDAAHPTRRQDAVDSRQGGGHGGSPSPDAEEAGGHGGQVEREVRVTCNGTFGTFLLPSQTVVCFCSRCVATTAANQTPSAQHALAITPTEFERHSGLLTAKKWRNSIRLMQGDGTVTIGKWLEQHNILPRPKCSGGPLGSPGPGGSGNLAFGMPTDAAGYYAPCGPSSGNDSLNGAACARTGGNGSGNGAANGGDFPAPPPLRSTLPPTRYPASEYVTGEEEDMDDMDGAGHRHHGAGLDGDGDEDAADACDPDDGDVDYEDGGMDSGEGHAGHGARSGRRLLARGRGMARPGGGPSTHRLAAARYRSRPGGRHGHSGHTLHRASGGAGGGGPMPTDGGAVRRQPRGSSSQENDDGAGAGGKRNGGHSSSEGSPPSEDSKHRGGSGGSGEGDGSGTGDVGDSRMPGGADVQHKGGDGADPQARRPMRPGQGHSRPGADVGGTQDRSARHAGAVKRMPEYLTGSEAGPAMKRARARPAGGDEQAYDMPPPGPQVRGWRFLGASAGPAADQVLISVTINGRLFTGLLAPQQSMPGAIPRPPLAAAASVGGRRVHAPVRAPTHASGRSLTPAGRAQAAGAVVTTSRTARADAEATETGADGAEPNAPAPPPPAPRDDEPVCDGMPLDCPRCALCRRCAAPSLSLPMPKTAAAGVASPKAPPLTPKLEPEAATDAATRASGSTEATMETGAAHETDAAAPAAPPAELEGTGDDKPEGEEHNHDAAQGAAPKREPAEGLPQAERGAAHADTAAASATVASAAASLPVSMPSGVVPPLSRPASGVAPEAPAAADDCSPIAAAAAESAAPLAAQPSGAGAMEADADSEAAAAKRPPTRNPLAGLPPIVAPPPAPACEASSTARMTGCGLGPLVSVKAGGEALLVHSQCALWSSDVFVIGGSMYGAASAVKRGRSCGCSRCGRSGATLACCSAKCGRVYHLPCAMEAGAMLVAEPFSVACPDHRAAVVLHTASSQPLPRQQSSRIRPTQSMDASQTTTLAAPSSGTQQQQVPPAAATTAAAGAAQNLAPPPPQVALPPSLQAAAGQRVPLSEPAPARTSRPGDTASSLPALMMLRGQPDPNAAGKAAPPPPPPQQQAASAAMPPPRTISPTAAAVAAAAAAAVAAAAAAAAPQPADAGEAKAEAAAKAKAESDAAAVADAALARKAAVDAMVNGDSEGETSDEESDDDEAVAIEEANKRARTDAGEHGGREKRASEPAAAPGGADVAQRAPVPPTAVHWPHEHAPVFERRQMAAAEAAAGAAIRAAATLAGLFGSGACMPPSGGGPGVSSGQVEMSAASEGTAMGNSSGQPHKRWREGGGEGEGGWGRRGTQLPGGLAAPQHGGTEGMPNMTMTRTGADTLAGATAAVHLSHAAAFAMLQQQQQQQQHNHHRRAADVDAHGGRVPASPKYGNGTSVADGAKGNGGEASVGSPFVAHYAARGMPGGGGRPRHHHPGDSSPTGLPHGAAAGAGDPANSASVGTSFSPRAASGNAARVGLCLDGDLVLPAQLHSAAAAAAAAMSLMHVLPRAARNIEGLLPSRPLLHNPYVPSSGDPSADLALSKIAQNGSREQEAELLGGTTGRAGHSGRCAVCVIQRKGKCGTESAPKKCLRRQLVALQRAGGGGEVDEEDVTEGYPPVEGFNVDERNAASAAAAAEQRARERARRETWSLPLGQGSGASGKRPLQHLA